MRDLLQKIQSNDGQFHNGNPATGEQGTRVTDTWLNDVQEHIRDFGEELKYLLQQAELEPNPAKKTQIYDAIEQIIENKRRAASLTQSGEVELDSSTDSTAEDKAATPKAVNAVKALVIAVRNALNNYIPNSKKSDAYNSSSSDTIATSYAVKKVRDIVENRFSSLANADGYKHVGRCKSVEMLRKVVPSKHGQRILLDAYYEGGTTGGGEFVADLQDLTTADDGGSCFVVLNNTARWKRIFDDRVDVVDFGAKSDEDATIAFENAFKYAGEHKKIITSDASTYFINKPLFLSGVGGIELNGKLYAKMTPENKSKPIITWAENAITLTQSHNNFINLVMWLEPTEDAPAICLAGLKSTNLKIGETGCVQIYATTEQTEQQVDFKGVEVSSTGYNRFDIDVLSTLHITGKGRGWVNENVINAQRFRALKAGFRAGILI
ncbi:tail fiber protein, partial [Pasteurella multocida]